jgi:hypothetical protein
MRKPAGGFGFPDEAFAVLRFSLWRLAGQRDSLHSYHAINLGIAGPVDHAHRSPAKFGQDLVAAEALAAPVFVHEFYRQAPTRARTSTHTYSSRLSERALAACLLSTQPLCWNRLPMYPQTGTLRHSRSVGGLNSRDLTYPGYLPVI